MDCFTPAVSFDIFMGNNYFTFFFKLGTNSCQKGYVATLNSAHQAKKVR